MLLICAAAAWADCPTGVYTTTDADKKFFADTVAAVKAAVPPASEGWRLDDKNSPTYMPPASLCKGAETSPLIAGYTVDYVWVAGQKELALKRAEIDKKEGAVRRTSVPPDQQKPMNELGTKDRDLRFQARKIAATDKAAADAMLAEAAGYAKQIAAIRAAYLKSLQPQLDELQKEETDLLKSYPTQLRLSILINGTGIDARDMAPSAAQAGAAITLSGPTKTILAYGGPWNRVNSGFTAAYPRGAKIQRVHGIVVEAAGDPKQAEALLAKLDGAALKGLIGK